METAGDFIITTEGKPICYATSEAAKMHFARNDDGQGLERGKLTWAIAYSQRVRTGPNGRQQRFTEKEIELLERKWAHFLRQDVEVILFNEDFFAAAVPGAERACGRAAHQSEEVRPMYAIISKGELLALCERPRYVKRNEETGAYVEAAEAEAIGIAVGGEVYNLPGGTAIPDAPEALAQEGEAEEYVFRNHARIIENEEATNAAFVAMEEAMCDMDSSSEERLTAVEEALCELDSAANPEEVKTDERYLG